MSSLTLEKTTDQSLTLTVIIEQAKNNWCAFTPDDIGVVVATGPTREETLDNFRAALKSHFAAMREQGLSVPNVTQMEVRETMAA